MKCIMLVGGYATRMGEIAKNTPKALLSVGRKTVLDEILTNIINSTKKIDEYILITNDTFYENFNEWKNASNYKEKITIISDGSTSNGTKVGAASALINAIHDFKIEDDLFVLAGDNLLDFSLSYIFDDFFENNKTCIMYYEEKEYKKLIKTGIIELDEKNCIIGFQEKPQDPKTNFAVPPFYWFKKKDIGTLLGLFEGTEKIDSMGELIKKLCSKTKIKAILMKGHRVDIGSLEDLNNYMSVR